MTAFSSEDPPIACSLSAESYKDRIAAMRRLASRALTDRADIPGGEVLTFAAGDGVESRLRELVAAESRCCAFLRFDLTHEADALSLVVTGPDDARVIIGELFA